MAKTAGGQILPELSRELKDRILTSALLNSRKSGEHEVWTGHKTPKGYGRITVSWKGERFTMNAHRAVWAANKGEWVDRFHDIDHICGNPSCINMAHLRKVKASEHSGVVRKKVGWKNQHTGR